MSDPLSFFTYYLKNLRKIIPITGIIMLSVLGISVTAAISGAMLREVNETISFYGHYYTADLALTPDSGFQSVQEYTTEVNHVRQELNKIEEIDYIIESQTLMIRIQAIFGNTGAGVFFLKEEDMSKFLDEMKVTLSQGKLPQGKEEIALGASLLANKNVSLGGEVGKKVDDKEWMPGKYKVVGVLEPKDDNRKASFGIGKIDNNSQTNLAMTFLIHPKTGQEEIVDSKLQKLKSEIRSLEVSTKQEVIKDIQDQFQSINILLWAINLVVVLTITASIALLQIIFFMQRSGEFGILEALGYSKAFIIRRTLLEATINVFLGWGIGIVFSEVVYYFLNHNIFYPKGMEGLTILEPQTLLFTVPVPVVVSLFSVGTVLWTLIRMDPVAIIERRD